MKFIIALAIFFVAAPAFAFTGPVGIPNENGCGMGAFVLARTGAQQERQRPPLFIGFDRDGDDNGLVREGRSDTFYMTRLENCIANK